MRLSRLLRNVVFVCLLLWGCRTELTAQSVAEQYLLHAVNEERTASGLAPLQWNPYLAAAARLHARQMAQQGEISHQFEGERDLTTRTAAAGATFSVIAENVGVASDAIQLHDAWMHSPPHRANILNPKITSAGIAIVMQNGQLWGVEDFARDMTRMSLEQQEARLVVALQKTGFLSSVQSSANARLTCAKETGYAGDEVPAFVMRYTTTDLAQIPDQLKNQLATGRYKTARVGSCHTEGSFTTYRLAILLFP